MSRTVVAQAVLLVGVATGCGGGDSPLPPAHSSSFFPVRGTDDAGGTTSELEWIYRMNGGEPVPLSPGGGVTVRYADCPVRVAGTTMTRSLNGTVANTDGSGWSGTVSHKTTDHFSPDSPAKVMTREHDIRSSLVAAGSSLTIMHLVATYDFGAIPAPTFYDRTDLDTLDVGFSESVQLVASDDATSTVRSGSTNQTLSFTESVGVSLSWTLKAVLPTFQVLGKDYANVVQVDETMTSTTTAGDAEQLVSTIWLAKGFGIIRQQTTGEVAAGVTETDVFELTRTNLVGP